MNRRLAVFIAYLLCSAPAAAEDVLVAVAANFRPTLERLVQPFESSTGHTLIVSTGSTGKLYAQILNGAPYDMFLAADAERPTRLEAQGSGISDTRFTYAMGRVILCGIGMDINAPGDWLQGPGVRRIALANPRHAPYGEAAMQALDSLGLTEQVRDKLVIGENVNQALQFMLSGNAEAAFIARSQRTAVWGACSSKFSAQPVIQQAIMLNDTIGTRDFKAFLQGAEAAAIIAEAGYEVPLVKQVLQEASP